MGRDSVETDTLCPFPFPKLGLRESPPKITAWWQVQLRVPAFIHLLMPHPALGLNWLSSLLPGREPGDSEPSQSLALHPTKLRAQPPAGTTGGGGTKGRGCGGWAEGMWGAANPPPGSFLFPGTVSPLSSHPASQGALSSPMSIQMPRPSNQERADEAPSPALRHSALTKCLLSCSGFSSKV